MPDQFDTSFYFQLLNSRAHNRLKYKEPHALDDITGFGMSDEIVKFFS